MKELFEKMWAAIVFLLLCTPVQAGKVDTLMVESQSMGKKIEVVVALPDGEGPWPVVYLLHGYGGNAHTWEGLIPGIANVADEKGMAFVCPDGANSWYWDSPVEKGSRYETFVARELVEYVDKHYPTNPDRSARAITGLSMGGHGAMWLSFRHKDCFGAAGSMSGGVDIRPFSNNWSIASLLGEEEEHRENWEAHTAINQIECIQDGDLALIVDCGYDDFFFEVNNQFHQKLLERGIGHDFYVRPGGHTAEYWSNSIRYHLLFFESFFKQQVAE